MFIISDGFPRCKIVIYCENNGVLYVLAKKINKILAFFDIVMLNFVEQICCELK